jgi:hypothetical protein
MFSLFDTSTKLMLFLQKKTVQFFVNLINIKSRGLFSHPHFLIPFMQQWNAKGLIALNFAIWMQILIIFQSREFASNI